MFVEASDAQRRARHTMLGEATSSWPYPGARRILVIPAMPTPTSTASIPLDPRHRQARPRRHPLRRRLRRRDAAHRRPVHDRVGRSARQRPVHPAQLPGRDPRAAGHPPGRLELPAALRRPRRAHPGRRAGRPRRDEPRRPQGQPRRRPARRDDHRQHRRVHQAQPREGRLPDQPARGRHAGELPRARARADVDHRRGARVVRPDAARTRSARPTCSRSACCRGSTPGRSR